MAILVRKEVKRLDGKLTCLDHDVHLDSSWQKLNSVKVVLFIFLLLEYFYTNYSADVYFIPNASRDW